jgi:Predicted transcriptional regulator
MKYFHLTKSELEIMEVFWGKGKPLSTNDILECSEDRTWKKSYIHIMIKSLQEKGAIAVSGSEWIYNRFVRLFQPMLSQDEYNIMQIEKMRFDSAKALIPLFKTMLDKNVDEKILTELESILDKKRKSI